jgi:hypothetical protein
VETTPRLAIRTRRVADIGSSRHGYYLEPLRLAT